MTTPAPVPVPIPEPAVVTAPEPAPASAPGLRREQVRTDPDPYAPFLLSQAIRVGDLVFVSGQAGYDQDGQIIYAGDAGIGGFDAQAEQAFANLDRVLRAAGSTLAEVIKVTIFLTDMAHFPRVVALRRRHFTPPYPADTIVEVTSLYTPAAMIEIEAVALAAAPTRA